MAKKKLTFEEAIERLEEIVEFLEAGEKGLEESLALFEEGIGLVRTCEEQLGKAESRLKRLVEGENGPELVPNDEGDPC